MTTENISFCTDEEILEELRKLGYNEVSPDVLEIMKDDLSQLITKEQNHLRTSVSGNEKQSTNDSDTIKYHYPQKRFHNVTKSLSETGTTLFPNGEFDCEKNYPKVMASNHDISKTPMDKYKNTVKSYNTGDYRRQENSSIEKLSTDISHDPCSGSDYNELNGDANEQHQCKRIESKKDKGYYSVLKQSYPQKQIPRLQRNFSVSDKTSVPETSSNSKFSDMLFSNNDISRVSAFDRYKNTFQNYKRNNYAKKHEINSPEGNENTTSEAGYQSSISSVSVDQNKIKRKVLRHRDGKPVITEEFLDIPSIFNSSYPETQTLDSSKSFSSDDLSWKSNSSTGSVSVVSPDALTTPRSTFSLSSTRSSNSRLINPHKKKNDPVAMYNYYKKFWNEFKPPGEKTHDKIRWAVRDKMLDYNL